MVLKFVSSMPRSFMQTVRWSQFFARRSRYPSMPVVRPTPQCRDPLQSSQTRHYRVDSMVRLNCAEEKQQFQNRHRSLWSRSEDQEEALKSNIAILDKLLENQKGDKVEFDLLHQYCEVLQGLASISSDKKLGRGVPQRAEKYMISVLEMQHTNDAVTVELLQQCLNAIIWTWSNSSVEDAALCVARARQWFDRLEKTSGVTVDSYHALLHALSRGRRSKGNRKQREQLLMNHAQQATQLLRYMQQQQQLDVSTETYNYVIRAWTKCRTSDATEQVMDLLREMESEQRRNPHECNTRPNTVSYCMAMGSWSHLVGRLQITTREQQDAMYAVQQVHAILEYMHKLHDAGVPDVTPNTVAYNTYISAWSRLSSETHPWAPLEAEKVFRRMQVHVEPDHQSYTTLMLAWMKSKGANAGIRANFWLDKQWEQYNMKPRQEMLPTTSAYNAVIRAWTNVGQPQKAQELLDEMQSSKEIDGRHPCPKPNTESFSHMIHAWLKQSNDSGGSLQAIETAAHILDQLIELERRSSSSGGLMVTSTPELYNGIIRAAAHCRDKGPEVMNVAIEVFDKYRSSRHALDHLPYVWLLKMSIECTHGQAQYDFVEQLFHDCCEDGLLSNVFVRTMADGPVFYSGWTVEQSQKMTQALMNQWPLPPSWCRNLTQAFHEPQWDDSQRKNFNIVEA